MGFLRKTNTHSHGQNTFTSQNINSSAFFYVMWQFLFLNMVPHMKTPKQFFRVLTWPHIPALRSALATQTFGLLNIRKWSREGTVLEFLTALKTHKLSLKDLADLGHSVLDVSAAFHKISISPSLALSFSVAVFLPHIPPSLCLFLLSCIHLSFCLSPLLSVFIEWYSRTTTVLLICCTFSTCELIFHGLSQVLSVQCVLGACWRLLSAQAKQIALIIPPLFQLYFL